LLQKGTKNSINDAFSLNLRADRVVERSALITELRSSLSQSHHLIPVDAGPVYREGYLFERRAPNRIARLVGSESGTERLERCRTQP